MRFVRFVRRIVRAPGYPARLRARALVAIGLCSLAPSVARAEPTGEQRAAATALFNQGKELMDTGDLAAACPRLEESLRLDPGIGTLLNVATCHELQGRTATAWAEFHEALALAERAQQPERVALASERIARLAPLLSNVEIVLAPGADRSDLEIQLDGAPIARAAWGTRLPVDPGLHHVSARARGRVDWATETRIEGPGSTHVEVPPLAEAPAPPAPTPQPLPSNGRTRHAETIESPGPGVATIAGWSLVATGTLSLAIGVVTGVATLDSDAESDRLCDPTCSQRGWELNQDAKTTADVSTATFVLGGAAVAAGVILVLTGGRTDPHAARAGTFAF